MQLLRGPLPVTPSVTKENIAEIGLFGSKALYVGSNRGKLSYLYRRI